MASRDTRVRVVAVVVALAMLVPIVAAMLAAIGG